MRKIFAALLGAALTAGIALAASAGTAAAKPVFGKLDQPHRHWREALGRLKREEGCFKAVYPEVAWHAAGCKAGPNLPFAPGGSVRDYSAKVTGRIRGAIGILATFGLTSESAVYKGNETPNIYSLQLNTNPFPSPACAGHSGCQAFQQFIYTSVSGELLIQYWLVEYGKTCPAGWFPLEKLRSCYTNSAAASFGPLPITALNTVEFQTFISKSRDYVVLQGYETAAYTSGKDSVISLSKGWNAAEFNVFGVPNGKVANFNSGTEILVGLEVASGSKSAPTCAAKSYTNERTNLVVSTEPPFASPPETWKQSFPLIAFLEFYPAAKSGPRCFPRAGP